MTHVSAERMISRVVYIFQSYQYNFAVITKIINFPIVFLFLSFLFNFGNTSVYFSLFLLSMAWVAVHITLCINGLFLVLLGIKILHKMGYFADINVEILRIVLYGNKVSITFQNLKHQS